MGGWVCGVSVTCVCEHLENVNTVRTYVCAHLCSLRFLYCVDVCIPVAEICMCACEQKGVCLSDYKHPDTMINYLWPTPIVIIFCTYWLISMCVLARSAPQMSSSLTFHSSFYLNKSAITLLYSILLLPHLSSSLTSFAF